MPFAFIIIVGIVFYNTGVIEKVIKSKQETTAEVAAAKPLEVELKQPEPAKEEVKVELKQPEPVKVELKQPEPVKDSVKVESNIAPKESTTDEVVEQIVRDLKADESDNNYLKIILYIAAVIAAIFSGFYFFSNRVKSQSVSSASDTTRKDLEENYQHEPQEQPPTQVEPQSDTTEQQPVEEEPQSDITEQQPVEEDNKDK